jgi:hypothetical protein
VPETAKAGRVDLRQAPLVTIDGADARDFDDAVFCERKPKGWRLLVCIADVSAYVAPGSALDLEGYNRGNSVYFPDRVIPMLPEILSNGLCSLNPQVDRLCLCCELFVGLDGKVSRSKFYQAVMRSQARLTYDQVAAMVVEGDRALCQRFAAVLPHLRELHALYQALHLARVERGAIDFDTTETRFEFNDQGRIAAIHPGCRVTAQEVLLEPGNVADWVPAEADYVLDAIDSVPAKLALVRLCQGRGQRLICVGGAGGSRGPVSDVRRHKLGRRVAAADDAERRFGQHRLAGPVADVRRHRLGQHVAAVGNAPGRVAVGRSG